jgi:glucose-6-phosphate 1-dehydrogenase
MQETSENIIIVFGASGDLAYKKTFPALYGLYIKNLLPLNTKIIGYARSKLSLQEFRSRISQKVQMSLQFLELCFYVHGGYDDSDSYRNLYKFICQWSVKSMMFYMALPPSVFIQASHNIKDFLYTPNCQNRLIVEKPFGKDSKSSEILSNSIKEKWNESEIYRIDHYLGKEMVKNLMILRFANVFFSAVWNSQYISNIQITFKEAIGTQGRGGYFDEFGIIRDVIQNHLLQILTIVAMERPVSKNADDVRDEKVKVLKSIKPISLDQAILGQYLGSLDGKEPGYLQDKTVPQDSITPTFATVVLYCNNERWAGIFPLCLY